ncbi:MAG TPA: amidohydrolase family protein, partial [Longimicrobiales bacterium]|nr:amidohydrolase family protein [Longimicrobiales bacterium]
MKAPTTLAALALFLVPVPGAGQDLVLENARVVDVEAGTVTPSRTVVIRDGRIERIASGSVQEPAGAERLDLGGRYLAPGLMDAHVHIGSEDQARRALESGVTTARSAGVGHYVDVGLSALIAEGHADGPELLATGYHVRPGQFEAYWLDNPGMARFQDGGLETVEGLRALTRTNLERGVRWIKAASTERAGLPHTDPRKQVLDRAQMTAIVETAAERGVPV